MSGDEARRKQILEEGRAKIKRYAALKAKARRNRKPLLPQPTPEQWARWVEFEEQESQRWGIPDDIIGVELHGRIVPMRPPEDP